MIEHRHTKEKNKQMISNGSKSLFIWFDLLSYVDEGKWKADEMKQIIRDIRHSTRRCVVVDVQIELTISNELNCRRSRLLLLKLFSNQNQSQKHSRHS